MCVCMWYVCVYVGGGGAGTQNRNLKIEFGGSNVVQSQDREGLALTVRVASNVGCRVFL